MHLVLLELTTDRCVFVCGVRDDRRVYMSRYNENCPNLYDRIRFFLAIVILYDKIYPLYNKQLYIYIRSDDPSAADLAYTHIHIFIYIYIQFIYLYIYIYIFI